MPPVADTGKSSTIQFLFRFRDLVAKTLDEHDQIIKEHGSCWWGWWKRPSESNRLQVWQQLADGANVAGASGIPVGLFDSGTEFVHIAWVTEVVLPSEETPGMNQPVEIPGDQKKLVPSYYRERSFSRAWMRIIKIERNIKFWKNYSFAEVPQLPNYDPASLTRLKGKIILDANELRGMDTTIWVIRPKQAGDLNERILLTIPAIHEAVSYEVVRCDSNAILHITDLHFAVASNRQQHVWRLPTEIDTQRRTMVDAIMAAIGTRKIGLVLITGDFSFIGEKSEFDEALAALRLLLGILNLSTDHVVVIPGNHDIRWTTDAKYDDKASVTQAPEEARKNYATFYESLFRHPPNPYLAMGRRYLFPSGVAVEICALNSSSLETGKNFLAGVGRINEAAFEEVANTIGWKEQGIGSKALRVLMVHHHLALTENLEAATGYPKGFGLALDAVRIQRLAARSGVQLALHGHKHRAFLWRSYVFELPEDTNPNYFLGELAIIGGGSSGSTDTYGNSNYFNLLNISPTALELTIYRSRNGGIFQPMQNWQAPFSISKSGQLLLNLWEQPTALDRRTS
ncbi:MAG TPA: metallophosphoesterase [Candidatus Angelobacter sp.]|jgi:3',5'-cyclic AMP phosphodiesterase CpdA|nr:metallophosphoesterase [Candidatus Angelobacter sp.]